MEVHSTTIELWPTRVTFFEAPVDWDVDRQLADEAIAAAQDMFDGRFGTAGDEVVILGRSAEGEPCAQEWAVAADTIGYEIVTRMGPRLPRVHVGGGS